MAHGPTHPPNLAVSAFSYRNLKPGVLAGRPYPFYLGRCRSPSVQHDAGLQALQGLLGGHTLDLGPIGLGDTVAGMLQVLGEFSVIRHDEESFGVIIEASHGKDACLNFFHKFSRRSTASGIMGRTEHLFWLVQYDGNPGL